MSTFTYTETDTYTESRAREVMKKVTDDFIGLACRDLITFDSANKWRDDILYMMKKKALKEFELQFSSGSPKGYKYIVSSVGYIYANDNSGGIDYYAYSENTIVKMFYNLDENSPNYTEVYNEMVSNRGVGTNGKSLEGREELDKTYSKDNYGVTRKKII